MQAVTFLVIHQKHKKTLEEITNDLCPVLSVQQLYRISTMYWDDRYNTETVSHDVLGRMKQLMVDNNTAASHSFLLDDDSSIPFSLDDIQQLMEDKVRVLHPSCALSMILQTRVFCLHFTSWGQILLETVVSRVHVCMHGYTFVSEFRPFTIKPALGIN